MDQRPAALGTRACGHVQSVQGAGVPRAGSGKEIGTADFLPLWNQAPRRALLHWDGNNTSVEERNQSAALGAGATPTTLDMPRLKRIAGLDLDLPPPAYPYAIDYQLALAPASRSISRSARRCHDPGGKAFGQVTSHRGDRHRPASARTPSRDIRRRMNTIAGLSVARSQHFRKTNGYANMPLDGIWLRAPYLHNGSVPDAARFLKPAEKRPPTFYKGNDVYDPANLGFVTTKTSANGREFFLFDTAGPGNGNAGHEYGTHLTAEQKDALLEDPEDLLSLGRHHEPFA